MRCVCGGGGARMRFFCLLRCRQKQRIYFVVAIAGIVDVGGSFGTAATLGDGHVVQHWMAVP